MSSRPVIILGAGIGGLAAALALHRAGIPVEVYESAPVLGEVGAGLGLLANAVSVLDHLGLGEVVRRESQPLLRAAFRTAEGRTLQALAMDEILPEGSPPNYVVHRADLHRWLREALPGDMIRTGLHCTSVKEIGDLVQLGFEGGFYVEGSVVIGADGFKSVLRRYLWGELPVRYSGQTCYRGIAQFTPDDTEMLSEIQGAGQRASVIYLGNGRSYWWAASNAEQNGKDEPATRRDFLLKLYQGWPFGVPEAIAATASVDILRNDLCDLAPLARWGKGRISLLGDAAHPMTPNLGQGACSAIEDAAVLARHLKTWDSEQDPVPLLRGYEEERIPRCSMLVKHSWQFGVPCRWKNPLAIRLRNSLVASIPRSLLERRFRSYLGFDAGSI